MPRFTPKEFAKHWGESRLSKRSDYQQHFLDARGLLCRRIFWARRSCGADAREVAGSDTFGSGGPELKAAN